MDQPVAGVPPQDAPLRGLSASDGSALLVRLLAIAEDAVVATDDTLTIVLFSEGAERLFGWRAAQAIGQPLSMLLPAAARQRHDLLMRRFGLSAHAARRMGERAEVRGRRVDGSLFEAEASIAQLQLDGRRYFAAIVRDVSEQRGAQRALAAGEARFRRLAESAPVGIFETDAAGACTYVNDRWCQLTGLSDSEARGQGWIAALHPADRARVRNAWTDAVAAAAPFEQRYRFVHQDGREVWVIGHAVAQTGAFGDASGYIGTLTDVTDSLRQSAELERAKSEAEAAARAKSLFLANMSHEIRTPLNAVIGMSTLLLDTPMSDDQRDFASTIRSSSETLLEIINDILDYSKADVGKLELEQRPFDLRRVIEDSLDLVSPRATEKGLNLAYVIEDAVPETLAGDPTRLRQILVNLLSNAVKFTQQGEVVVAAEGQPIDAHTQRLRLTVRDTGIGIAAAQLPRLFQSFTQVDASTTRKYGGTGLGLAIVKRLAELMGGSVAVASEPGLGSSFEVVLPLALAPAGAPAEFLCRDAPLLQRKRVLIVDDNQTNRRLLAQLALRWGMLPTSLASAAEALDQLRHGERFDIALLDMSMPEVDGLDLAHEIRRRRSAAELPILLLTSLGHRHLAGAPGSTAIDGCLSKPIKAAALYELLTQTLAGRSARPEAGAAAAPGAPPARLRVLVAEDNPTNQRVTLRLLTHLGHQAEVVADGRQAVEQAARAAYDVVLMDIQMPELDGVSAARAIVRARGGAGAPRILAMTANAMPGDREAYLAAGMDGYVAKPVTLGELARALDPLTDAAPGAGAPAPQEPVLDETRLEHLRTMQDQTQPDLVRELIDQFLADAPAHLQRLQQAVHAREADTLRAVAHRFLSTTQNVGAQRLSRLCAELEQLARSGRIERAEPLLPALADEQRLAQDALMLARMRY